MYIIDITTLAIKISGIVLFVLVVSKIPEYVKGYLIEQQRTETQLIWHYVIPLLIPAVIAFLFVTLPLKITDNLVFRSGPEIENKLEITKIEVILIRILGLYLLFWAISDLLFHVSTFLMIGSVTQERIPLSGYNYPYIIATIGEFIFAFWLLIGTSNVIRFLNNIRR